jgi:hypothetical protein
VAGFVAPHHDFCGRWGCLRRRHTRHKEHVGHGERPLAERGWSERAARGLQGR